MVLIVDIRMNKKAIKITEFLQYLLETVIAHVEPIIGQ